MIRPDFQKWDQTVADIRRLSIEAEHPRSRGTWATAGQSGAKRIGCPVIAPRSKIGLIGMVPMTLPMVNA